jgi:hypothetical protein
MSMLSMDLEDLEMTLPTATDEIWQKTRKTDPNFREVENDRALFNALKAALYFHSAHTLLRWWMAESEVATSGKPGLLYNFVYIKDAQRDSDKLVV